MHGYHKYSASYSMCIWELVFRRIWYRPHCKVCSEFAQTETDFGHIPCNTSNVSAKPHYSTQDGWRFPFYFANIEMFNQTIVLCFTGDGIILHCPLMNPNMLNTLVGKFSKSSLKSQNFIHAPIHYVVGHPWIKLFYSM